MKHFKFPLFCTILSLFTGLFTQKGSGQPITQQAKLVASDGATDDYFSRETALSNDGNTAIMGAYGDDGPAGATQGAAYIFTRTGTTWTQAAKLIPGDAAAGDNFGNYVAISGDGNTAIVGASGDDGAAGTSQGSAYIFVRNGTTWTQQAKLLASDAAAGDQLGNSVSLSSDGNTAAVGSAYNDGVAGIDLGAAYIYTRSGTTWTQQTELVANDGAAGDFFGWALSLSSNGNTIMVGAYRDKGPDGSLDQGSAYIFTRTGTSWQQNAKLSANDATIGQFGISVAISGDGNTAVAGALYAPGTAAYIYNRTGLTWTLQTKLQGNNTPSIRSSNFVSASSNGNMVMVGAHNYSGTAGTNQGAAYLYTRNGATWSQQAMLVAGDAAAGDFFGISVAISGDANTAIVGALYGDGAVANQGAAYIFAPATILPLSLSQWSVAKQASTGVLHWQVAQEQNIATYSIERSSDSRSFTTVGTVASLGNAATVHTYNFTDLQPLKGANYYRLKITEQDGKTSYSELRLLNFGSQVSIALFPNPTKGKATITGVEAGMQIRLLNAAGQILYQQQAAGNTLIVPVEKLSSGMYQVQVYGTNSRLLNTTSFIKE